MQRKGAITRWLYQGQHPNPLARAVNRIWATLFALGIARNYAATLEVIGRKSGRHITLPVAIARVGGARYLVSMLGDNVQWVQNVRATGGRAVLRAGRRTPVCLQEVPAVQRAPILKAYLQIAPGARPHIPVDKDAPLADFAQIAATYPVFRIDRKSVV